MREVVIEVPEGAGSLMSPWGPVGGPPEMRGDELWGMDPVFLVTPCMVGAALRPGGTEWRGVLGIADRSGILTLISPAGTWVYELFPASWSDDRQWRNSPVVYVAVWPD